MINAINRRDIPNHKLEDIIQAGDALRREVEIDVEAFSEAGDFTESDRLRKLVEDWDWLVSDYRGE